MTDSKEWSFESLEKYLSEKVYSLEKLVDQRHMDSSKALDIALQSMERRLESMNEFRQALADQRLADEKSRGAIEDTFVTKEIYGIEHSSMESTISKNADRIMDIDKKLFAVSELKVDRREGLSSKYMTSAILFAALSFVISIAGIFLNYEHEQKIITEQSDIKGAMAKNPVERTDLELLTSRLDALSRRLNEEQRKQP